MTIQTRRRRRLAIIALVLMTAGGSLAGMYVYRQHKVEVTAKAHRESGMAAVLSRDDAAVLDHLGAYLRRFDEDVEALYEYASSRQRIEAPRGRHLTESIGVLQRVVDLAPTHAQAKLKLLDLYTKCGYNHETIDLAQIILLNDPLDPDAWRAKAVALARLRQFPAAKDAAERAVAQRPFDIRAAVLLLDVRLQLGTPGSELVASAKAHRLAHAPSPVADLYEAYAHRLAGNMAASIDLLRAAAAGPAADESYVVMLVMLLDDARLSEASMAVLEKASKETDSETIRAELVRRLWESNRYKEVDERLASINPARRDANDVLLGLRAASLYELGRRDEAKVITAALAARGADSIGAAWASVLDVVHGPSQGRPQAIIAACKDALGADPGNAYFAYMEGAAWWSLGETDLALASWKLAIKQRPAWPTPRISTVHALLAAGQTEQAQREARLAIERTPHRVDAIAAWVVAHAATLLPDDIERAQQLLVAAAAVQRVAPYETQTLPLYIALQAQCGKPEIAAERLRQVLAKSPPLDEATWLKLASVSQNYGLKLEAACHEQITKRSGITPGLVLAQANDLAAKGQAEAGRQLLVKAAAAQPNRNALAWQMAMGRYLDQINDASALAHWTTLADAHADDLRVQSWALQTRSVQRDSATQDRLIDRLRELSGPQAVTWRLARAQKLMAGADGQSSAEAAALLQGVVAEAPTSLSAQVLLARSLERMNLDSKASAQITAAARVQPQSVELALEAARLLQAQHDFAGARNHLLRIADRSDLDPLTTSRVAAMLARQGEDVAAIRLLDAMAIKAPLSEHQLLLLGVLGRRQGDRERVNAIITQLLASPTAAGIEFAADYHGATGDTDKARQNLTLLDNPTITQSARASILAKHEQRFGTPEKALELWRQAVASDPAAATLHRALIAQLIRMDQATQAIEALAAARQLLPNNAEMLALHDHKVAIAWAATRPMTQSMLLVMILDESQQAPLIEGLEVMRGITNENRIEMLSRLRTLCQTNMDCLTLVTVAVQLHVQHGRAEDAMGIAGAAMVAHPMAWEGAWIKSETMGALGRWDEALVAAQEWRLRSAKDTILADLMIAEAYHRLARPADAAKQLAEHLPRAKARPEQHGEVLWKYVRSQVALGKVDIAADLLAPLWKESQPWRLRAIDLGLQTGITESKAVAWLDRVYATLAADAGTERTRLAATWLELGGRFKSDACRRRADQLLVDLVKATDASAEQWFLVGILAEQDGDVARAELAYRATLKRSPNMAAACNNLAMVLASEDKRLDEALAMAGEAVRIDPQSAGYLDTLAHVQHRLRLDAQAVASARRAVALQPENPQWRKRLAIVLTPRSALLAAPAPTPLESTTPSLP